MVNPAYGSGVGETVTPGVLLGATIAVGVETIVTTTGGGSVTGAIGGDVSVQPAKKGVGMDSSPVHPIENTIKREINTNKICFILVSL
jgi:hypothetical protein